MLIYLSNLFVPLLEIDAAQYAEMSREMIQTDNWLYVYDLGTDYLDKPPFLFWISALSMKLFGISVWAYKLPSVLFGIWSIYALFKFASLFYPTETAKTAALLFASCQAMFLITHDIKTDTILMSFVITAFWQLSSWFYRKNKIAWLPAAICIGGAMITKGPIGLLIIGFGFVPHFIIKKEWKNLFRWQYLPMLLIIGLVLLPMNIGLYEQFDLHPEKKVNGDYGVSGLRFFYWTQSFGRITGESVWNNNATFSFLYENLLWGFIPFTIFFIMATIKGFIKLFRSNKQIEWISTAAVLLGYFSLGMSKFQLPHYIYVVLPFICLLVGRYYVSIKNYYPHKFEILRAMHKSILMLAFAIFPFLLYLLFPSITVIQISILVACSLLIIFLFIIENKNKLTLWATTVGLAIVFNIMLNLVFYPNLIPFQKEYTIAKQVQKLKIPVKKLATFNLALLRSVDFTLQQDIPLIKKTDIVNYGFLITNKKGLIKLDKKSIPYSIRFKGASFHIAKLNIGFLNPNTRSKHTETYYIVELK